MVQHTKDVRTPRPSYLQTIITFDAPSVADQKKYARQMEQQLLKDTPAIYSFFYNFIAAASPKVHGYVPDGIAVVNLRGVTIA